MMQGVERYKQKNISQWLYILLILVVIAARMLVALSQRIFLTPYGSGLDDELMIRAAMSISEGGWLGAYGPITIAKNMGFALWLALLHSLHIPLLAANAALWLLACAFAVWAVRPLFCGNAARAVLFAFLAFQPVSFAQYTMRVYRDAIFPAFCLLAFAGVAGYALRLKSTRIRGMLAAALGAGAGLAGGWLLREDGAVLLPYALCGLGLAMLYAILHKAHGKTLAKVLLGLVPFGVLVACILAFSAVNYARYGVFMVNDMTSGTFPGAYGAVVAVAEGENGFVPGRPATREALEKMYTEVPSMAVLQPYLEAGPALNGFGDPETGDFKGSFYFGLRIAAEYAGVTPDGVTAQQFWAQLEKEIRQAVAEGRLQSIRPRASTLPRFHKSFVLPTARETRAGFFTVVTFQDTNPRPQTTDTEGVEAYVQSITAYLHSPVQQGFVAGTSQPYFNVGQRAMFALCDMLVLLYAVAIWPLLGVGLWRMGKGLLGGVKTGWQGKRLPFNLLLWILVLGLALSFVLRLVVAAYMEVAAFGIGTYLMYLSGGVPALLLFCAVGLVLPLPDAAVKNGVTRHLLVPAQPDSSSRRRDLTLLSAILLGLGLVGLKLLLAGAQRVYLYPAESPIDDMLMFNAAQAISKGEWLGQYGWLTLSKHTFFSLWLYIMHLLHIPYLLATQLLWAAASLAAALAFAPVVKRRGLGVALFGVLLFNPASVANPLPEGYITRVYRDAIFPALCLLCIAGMVGFALRRGQRLRRSVVWLLVCGAGLAGAFLTREDGWWLLPFVVAASVVTLVMMWKEKIKLLRGVALLLPFAVLAGGMLGWMAQNNKVYGRFIMNDFSTGEFADAYGAMTRIEHANWHPQIAVPRDVREQLYAHVPAFAELEPILESGLFYSKYQGDLGDYSSGAFYWALREAAQMQGHYDTPETSKIFFTNLAADINALCDDGTLAAGPRRSSVNPPIRAEYVLPVTAEALRSLVFCATFQQASPQPMRSIGTPEELAPIEAFLRETAIVSAVPNTDEPYLLPQQITCLRMLEIIRGVYALLLPLGCIAALFLQVVFTRCLVKKWRTRQKAGEETMLWFIQLGLLFCILLRCFMIAFVTVSSFTIGTFIMYLASVHPLMLLYAFTGVLQLVRMRRRRKAGGEVSCVN